MLAMEFVRAGTTEPAPNNVLDRVRGLKAIDDGNLNQVDEEGSAFQRYEIWKVARTIIREHPVTGVGLGAYPAAHRLTATRSQFNPTARGRRDTHSTYLNVTAETAQSITTPQSSLRAR